MKKQEKASISLKRILGICLAIIALTSVSVMGTNSKLNNVKIILSNNYEMTIVTSKTKISEILKENNIELTEDEIAIPNLEEELTENKTIKIIKNGEEEQEIAEKETIITKEEILQNYDTIIEKLVTEQVTIPFETITKVASSSSSEGTKQDRIIQKGQNGIKEVTYKIKYQNEIEIEKIQVEEKIIKEPINKIIEVKTIKITSRGSSTVKRVANGKWNYAETELDLLCAITAQECSTNYSGALAVITCAANRAESSRWSEYGSDPLSQYKAPSQFCYSTDSKWRKKLNGNYPSYVKEAVIDALNGKRNHNYLSFRAAGTHNGVNIGGNVYFNEM